MEDDENNLHHDGDSRDPGVEEKSEASERVQWHKVFDDMASTDLYLNNPDGYEKGYEILVEHAATKLPGRMDMLVRRKEDGFEFQGPVYEWFRLLNIVEFKSAEDELGTDEFFQAVGYACSVLRQENVRPQDVTITLVREGYPRELVKFLKSCDLKFDRTLESQGILRSCNHQFFPMQIVTTSRLDEEKHRWLRQVQATLTHDVLDKMMDEARSIGHAGMRNVARGALKEAIERNLAFLRENKVAFAQVMEAFEPEFQEYLRPRILKIQAEADAKIREIEAQADTKVREIEAQADTRVREIEAQADTRVREIEAQADTRVREARSEERDKMLQDLQALGVDPALLSKVRQKD